MKDVPSQYKALSDACTNQIMSAARRLWPIIRELGDNFECGDEGGPFIVTIEPAQIDKENPDTVFGTIQETGPEDES